jgi:hypothetical protein
MRILAGIVSAFALVGATGADAQIVYPDAPYYPGYPPPVIVAPPAPVVVAPPPYGTPYVAPYPYAAPSPYAGVVNPYNGRWCSYEPSGYRWCWTP